MLSNLFHTISEFTYILSFSYHFIGPRPSTLRICNPIVVVKNTPQIIFDDVETRKSLRPGDISLNSTMLGNFKKNAPKDIVSGFFVFLIALPLCLGIAKASGFPPIAGLFTAILGGIITPWFSNSELTIKGPAAGLIVIVAGAVQEFTELTKGSNDPMLAYRLTLGVGVVAGVLQIIFGLLKAGRFSDFFPKAAVHGMLAAIGIIIFSKQFHTVLGVVPESKEPLKLLLEIPNSIMNWNPEVACIGFISLAILFSFPLMPLEFRKFVPAPMVVIILGIAMGHWFDLEHEHKYLFLDHHEYDLGPRFLVEIPSNLLEGITFPLFTAVTTWVGIKWILLFSLVGTLESILSAKAVDMIDPLKRKTDLDRDVLGIGIANTIAAFIGGLPMISEILRSKANIDNGAKSRFSNTFHGLFILLFVATVPWLIHSIPLASLAGLLVYTGYRLASPGEFVKVYKIGPEQLIVFASTCIGVLATDLLIGVAIGMLVKVCIHLYNGAKLRYIFSPNLSLEQSGNNHMIMHVKDAMVFTNWLSFKKSFTQNGAYEEITIDLSTTSLVDHTVMESLEELVEEEKAHGRKIHVQGLTDMKPVSSHPHSARKSTVMTVPDFAKRNK